MEDKRKQFTFYESFFEALELLPKSQQLETYRAVARYGLYGERTQLPCKEQQARMTLIRPVLDTAKRNAEMGAKGGRPKKPPFSDSENPPFENPKSEGENENEKEIENENETDSFRAFWDRYPVKVGRKGARKAWTGVRKEHSVSVVMEGLTRWLGSEQWKREDGRFVPKPEKWLLEEQFLEEPKQAVPMGASGQLGQAELEAIQRLLSAEC